MRGLKPEEREERREKDSKELVEELFVNFKKVLPKLARGWIKTAVFGSNQKFTKEYF